MSYTLYLQEFVCHFSQFIATAVGQPKLSDLLREVKTVKWFELGLELTNDDRATMNIIRENNRGNVEGALRDTFNHWLAVCEHPTWQAVTTALRKIGENNLAGTIERNYCN